MPRPKTDPVEAALNAYFALRPEQRAEFERNRKRIIQYATSVSPPSTPLDSFASDIRPVAVVTSLPILPDPAYPPGQVVYHAAQIPEQTGLYKVNAAGTDWDVATTNVASPAKPIQIGKRRRGRPPKNKPEAARPPEPAA